MIMVWGNKVKATGLPKFLSGAVMIPFTKIVFPYYYLFIIAIAALVGIAFGCLLSNLPMGGMYHQELWTAFMDKNSEFYHSYGHVLANGGLLDFFYIGVKTSLYPCLIFLGVGAMTDFGP
ncbi:MAG: sodium ion-translocating decarboxylase subunit beta, partial [Clostridiales bacterium]|nr:sodium ion-translocating decarboxylase subunit beta [Clostridiales bacterium]